MRVAQASPPTIKEADASPPTITTTTEIISLRVTEARSSGRAETAAIAARTAPATEGQSSGKSVIATQAPMAAPAIGQAAAYQCGRVAMSATVVRF